MKPRKRDKDLTDTYRMENPLCELWDILEGEGWDKMRTAWDKFHQRRMRREDYVPRVHHVYGGPHRWDVWPNLVCASDAAHEWCHKYPESGRIVCLWLKADKGELDRGVLRKCFGFDVIGRVQSYVASEEWLEGLKINLLERF